MAAGTLTEEVITEVATNLEEVAQATRRLDARGLAFFGSGLGVGAAVGFYFGMRWNREKIKALAFEESQEEIKQIRDHYEKKAMVLDKPPLEEIIEEQGYSQRVERPLPAPVPLMEVIETPAAVVQVSTEKNAHEGWNYATELESRSPNVPYVIHEDEYRESEHDYTQTTYTYWEGDDVLTDSDNVPCVDRELTVGFANLRWGHGSGDTNVVFIRNDRLELEAEVTRDPRSWEEEIQGLDGPEGALRHSHQNHPARRRR